MNRKHDQISPPDFATPTGACGRAIPDSLRPESPSPGSSSPGVPAPALLASIDLAAEAAAFEAGRVSERLATGMLSLTNLTPDSMPRLLRHS